MSQIQVTRRWAPVVSLCLGFFAISFDGSVISVATPVLIDDLRIDTATALWATSGYLLAFAAPLLLAGRLGDRFGPRRMFLVGMAGFALASIGCALASGIGWLVAWRVVQGLGAALAAPQSMAIIRRTVDESWRGRAMGLWSATSALANLLAPPLGGVLIAWLGWRAVFWMNVPLGAIVFVLVALTVPTLRGERVVLRASDTIASAIALTGIALALQFAGSQAPVALVSAVLGLVAVVVFVRIEQRLGARALLPPGLGRPQFLGASVGVGVLAFVVTATPFPVMLFAQNAAGLSTAEASLLLVPLGLIGALLAVPVGQLIDRFGAQRVLPFGLTLLVSATFAIGIGVRLRSLPIVAIAAAFAGMGSAGSWAPTSVLSMQRLSSNLAGAGSGAYNASRQFGALAGVAVVSLGIQLALAGTASDPEERARFALGEVAGGVDRYADAMALVLFGIASVALLSGVSVLGARRELRSER